VSNGGAHANAVLLNEADFAICHPQPWNYEVLPLLFVMQRKKAATHAPHRGQPHAPELREGTHLREARCLSIVTCTRSCALVKPPSRKTVFLRAFLGSEKRVCCFVGCKSLGAPCQQAAATHPDYCTTACPQHQCCNPQQAPRAAARQRNKPCVAALVRATPGKHPDLHHPRSLMPTHIHTQHARVGAACTRANGHSSFLTLFPETCNTLQPRAAQRAPPAHFLLYFLLGNI
jgi:hypothetical protein